MVQSAQKDEAESVRSYKHPSAGRRDNTAGPILRANIRQ